ncbi:MAG: 3-hydroxybutyrate dehydrogenase [Acidobacteria bacterium]|nr:3-hydroxybutyrate dehydrogenase [Acidobacteriota bacterium]
MTIDLSDKTAVVTGAASGIGLEIAAALKASGASVCMADLQPDALEISLAELTSVEGRAVTCIADVSISDQVEKLRQTAIRQLGQIDILINCAGLQYVSSLGEFPLEQWDRLMNVMLRGSFLCTQQFLPGMMSKGWGRIVNIASIHSVVASKFKAAYVSAKHGLIGLTKTAALEAAEAGVTVNAVSPAYVRTPLVERQIASQAAHHGISEDEVIKKIMLAPMPQRELIDASEIGEIVVFLCSDAARHINGHNLVVDGGWTIA